MPTFEHSSIRDREIMLLVQGGDRTALAELYDRHATYLQSVALRFVRDTTLAEDILHDVFIEVWQYAGTYRPERANVRTWIAMRMRSRCLDRLRTRQARARLADGLDAEPAPARMPSPDARIDGQRAVALATRTLPEAQRVVLELGYYHGLSYAEVATELDIPLGTVKSRMRVALKTLRSEFRSAP